VHLSTIRLVDFRNYADSSVTFPADGFALVGPNGSGKTNFLEAIHVLCIGRSQRGATRTAMIAAGRTACCIEGRFRGAAGESHDATIGFSADRRSRMQYDGAVIESFSRWFTHGAVVSFGPDDIRLVGGSPSERRRFLDMLISQIDPRYMDCLAGYVRALANRNRLLASGAPGALFETYEAAMAAHAAYLYRMRHEIVAFCQPIFEEFHREICGGSECGSIDFRPSVCGMESGSEEGQNVFYNILKNKRKDDVLQGRTTTGPHRDDIVFFLDGKPARAIASQGQCRTLALSLRMSSVVCLERHKNEPLMFLVDDAFSELDGERTARLMPLLRNRGQVCAAVPEGRVPAGMDMAQFTVCKGSIHPR